MADHPFSFSKKEHLCSESQITELFQSGESFISYPVRVVLQVREAVGEPEIRVVMSVPKKKLKHAVDRNRVKRLLRETYRLNKQELWSQAIGLNLSVRMAFIWIPSEVLGHPKVEKKMKEALLKAGNLLLSHKTDEATLPEMTAPLL